MEYWILHCCLHFEHCQTSLTCLFIRPDALDSPGTAVAYKPLDIVRHLFSLDTFYFVSEMCKIWWQWTMTMIWKFILCKLLFCFKELKWQALILIWLFRASVDRTLKTFSYLNKVYSDFLQLGTFSYNGGSWAWSCRCSHNSTCS